MNFTSYFNILPCPFLGINLYILCFMNIWTNKTSKERAGYHFKTFYSSFMHSFLYTRMWASVIKKNTFWTKSWKRTISWIQNDKQNRSPPQSLTVIITSSLVDISYHNITQFWCDIIYYDCVRLSVVFRFLLHLCFFVWKFCTEDVY